MDLPITDIEQVMFHGFLRVTVNKLAQDDQIIDSLFEKLTSKQRDLIRLIPKDRSGLRSVVYFAFDILQQVSANDEFDAKLKMLARICIKHNLCCRPPFESCADYLYWILEKANMDDFSEDLRLTWFKTIDYCINRMDCHMQSINITSETH